MKKYLLFIICAIGINAMQAKKVIISNLTAGALYSAIKQSTATHLDIDTIVLAGTINAKDFVVLRDSLVNLSTLDLSETKIIAYTGTDGCGGASVSSYYANTLPNSAFTRGNDTLKLTSLKLPSTITAIDEQAFWGCHKLENLEIPYSVKTIADAAFLTLKANLTVSSDNTVFVVKDDVLYSKDMLTLYWCNTKKTGSYSIPTSVTTVKAYAFGNSQLTNISIPESVVSLGEAAFFSTKNVQTLTFPQSITILPDYLLQSSSVTSITIPSSVTKIGLGFAVYSKLQSITIPRSVTSIGEVAFSSCAKLKNAIVKAKVNTIPRSMFDQCSSLEVVQLPYGITTIDYNAFYNCISLRKINIPTSVTSIGNWAFSFCTKASFIVANSTPDKIYLGTTVFNFKKDLSTLS